MLNDLDRRILAKACGLEWHEQTEITRHGYPGTRCSCGLEWDWKDTGCKGNPTFSTADDWELVRVKVILPNILLFESIIYDNGIQWWLQKTSHELCKTAVDIIKAHPNRFPWVVEVMEVNV